MTTMIRRGRQRLALRGALWRMKEATEYHKQQLAAAHAENAELWKSNKMLLGQFAQEQAENAKLRQERDMMLEAFGKVPHLKPFIEEWLKTRQADINAKLKGGAK